MVKHEILNRNFQAFLASRHARPLQLHQTSIALQRKKTRVYLAMEFLFVFKLMMLKHVIPQNLSRDFLRVLRSFLSSFEYAWHLTATSEREYI